MQWNLIYILVVVSLILILSPISSSEDDQIEGYKVFTIPSLIRDNTETSISIELNQKFLIRIRGNPTTGYQIFLKDNLRDLISTKGNIVTPLNLNKYRGTDEFLVDKHQYGYVGVGGFYYFKFSADETGETQLIFENKRIWDTSDATFLKVNIKVV